LPTDDEWRQMAKHYGGISEDSDDKGKVAYKALLAGAVRDSAPCSAVAVPAMASMRDWKPTDSTGRHRIATRPLDGSTTLQEAGKLSIVKAVARRSEHFPCGVSGVTTDAAAG
jgi:hypothetical protein